MRPASRDRSRGSSSTATWPGSRRRSQPGSCTGCWRAASQGAEEAVTDPSEAAQVRSAADRLVTAFGGHDRDEYFACFAPDATFIFYTTPAVLGSRAAYEAEFAQWERDGFRVLECISRDQRVQVAGDAAVFTHRVSTRALSGDEEVVSDERETIVFRRDAEGRWLAIHEHLSPTPPPGPGT